MASGTSSIHYKFGNDVVLKRLSFEGIHIPLEELKKSISQVEGINLDYVDLSLTNADTKREYEGSCFIPRNSTVILKRVPRATPIRMPKVNNADASGAVLQKNIEPIPAVNHINQEVFAKMSEEERLKHVKMISTQKYNPINFVRKHQGFQNGTVPPDFRCHRCGILGHHPKQCLMQIARKTTGIPSEELMDASPSDPNALLHQSGRYVIPILHYKARETRKLVDRALFEREQQLANNKDNINNTVDSKLSVPQELECPLCHQLLVDALLAPCCGESFCAECIQNYMLKCSENDEGTRCPTCPGSRPLSVDSLIPNKRIRDAVQRHKALIATTTTKTSGAIPLAAVPVAAHESKLRSFNGSPVTINGISNSPSPPSSQIIQLPTVNLMPVVNPSVSPQSDMIIDLIQSPSIYNAPKSASISQLPDISKADLPPGINPATTSSSLGFNPNVPPPNMSLPAANLTNLNQKMNPNMNINRPPMGYYYNPTLNGSSNISSSPILLHTSNDGPPGISRASRSSIDLPPGTEFNSYRSDRKRDNIYDGSGYFGNIPITSAELTKINNSWDSVKIDDEDFLQQNLKDREPRDTRTERRRTRSRSPRDRTTRHNRDRKERDKDREDERKHRTSRDKEARISSKEEKSSRRHKDEKSSKKHKEERSKKRDKEDGHDESSRRHRKDKEHGESSKHKKKSSKKEKKKKKDHDS